MRQWLIDWLANELGEFVDAVLIDWLESGRLLKLLTARSEVFRASMRQALDDLVEQDRAANTAAATATEGEG